jgi:hypothetical protein
MTATIAQGGQQANDKLSLQMPKASEEASTETLQTRIHSLLIMEEVTQSALTSTLTTQSSTVFKHKRTEFVIDSGATIPITPYAAALVNMRSHLTKIMIGNGTTTISYVIGDMGAFSDTRVLTHTPKTIVPISSFTNLGYQVVFGATFIRLEHAVPERCILFATMKQGIMTVEVNHFLGFHFEELTDDDMPPLEECSDLESDDDNEVLYLRNNRVRVSVESERD